MASRIVRAADVGTWQDEAERFVRDSDQPGSGYSTRRVAADLPDQWRTRLDAAQVERIERVVQRFPSEVGELG